MKNVRGVLLVVFLWGGMFAIQGEASSLRIGHYYGPKVLDPAVLFSSLEFNIAMQMFEGLTALDPEDLTPQPGVAAD